MTTLSQAVAMVLTEDHFDKDNEWLKTAVMQAYPDAGFREDSIGATRANLIREGKLPEEAKAVRSRKAPATGSTTIPISGRSTIIPALVTAPSQLPRAEDDETAEERGARIQKRFDILERFAYRLSENKIPALIVSGPPGLGKSFTIEEVLFETRGEDPVIGNGGDKPGEGDDDDIFDGIVNEGGDLAYDIVCGSISASALYIALWNTRNGGVLVLDDTDDVFRDETSLNLLKAALDSSAKRRISWRKQSSWLESMGIDSTFEYKGSVVFCTNIDFESAIARGNAMGRHFQALIDRSLYLSLTMHTMDDILTRIRQVSVEAGMLTRIGLNEDEAEEVMGFIELNAEGFYNLSLRLATQCAQCLLASPETWKDDIGATKMRTDYRMMKDLDSLLS